MNGTSNTEASRSRPLVTVIVPVWNGARYLRESLGSILKQTYAPIEVIVMDDASDDATPEIAQSYGEQVRYCRQPSTRGIYGNANQGIAMARGEFIAIYHADDIYDPRIVGREVAFLERYPEAGAVFSSMVMIDRSGNEAARLTLPPTVRGDRPVRFDVVLNTMLLYKNQFLMCPSSMVRASVYRDVGVYRDEQFRNTSDVDMWLRIARAYPIGVLEEHLLRYRFGHGSSAQRYHYLRTDPNRYFAIMDLHLAEGGRALASSEGLRAHEAHRSEDALICAINAYILDKLVDSRRLLRKVNPSSILRSARVQRGRLVLMYAVMQLLVRLPRLPVAARAMTWRWHGAGRPGPSRPVRFVTP
jgi:glycosyltransferase involved in cell wall biosynthesis